MQHGGLHRVLSSENRMKSHDVMELIDFLPLTEGGYAIVPKGRGMRLPYASDYPPLEKPWHGYRYDCTCAACRRHQRQS